MHRELNMATNPFVAWRYYCRQICMEAVDDLETMIGGEGCTVQIDESLFSKRKYNRGQVYPEQWVFGGINSENNDCFMVIVPNRTKETLQSIIRQKIRRGTTIISDCWASYNGLELLGYEHKTVNHSYNFVDPITLAHTQKVESLWFLSKRRNQRECGTKRSFLSSYLGEFIWRKRIAGDEPFIDLLKCIAKYYELE